MSFSTNSHNWFFSIIIIISLFSLPYSGIHGSTVDVTKFTEIKIIKAHKDTVLSVAWSPNGTELASASWDQTVKIWDPKTGKNLKTLSGFSPVAWSPNGYMLASGSAYFNETIIIWNTSNWTIFQILPGRADMYHGLTWSPDGSKLALLKISHIITIWNTTNWTILNAPKENVFYSIAWNPDSNILACGSYNDNVSIWDVNSNKYLKNMTDFSTARTMSVAWSPDGKLLASATNDIKIWDYQTGKPLESFSNLTTVVDYTLLAWNKDNTILAGLTPSLTYWDVPTGKLLSIVGYEHDNVSYVQYAMAWNPNGNEIATGMCPLIGSTDHLIIIWGIKSPNVFINSMTADKTDITIGDNVTITVKISNNGTADGLNTKIDFYDDAIPLTTKSFNVPHDNSNITSYIWQTNETTRLGAHNLRVLLGMEEKNVTVIVKGKPNIFIKDLVMEKSNLFIGDKVNITATIANNGTADGINLIVNLYDGEKSLIIQSINVSYGGTGVIAYSWTTNNSTYIGIHNIRAVVGMNEKNRTVIINGKPNVYLSGIIVDRQSLIVGEKIRITGIIINNGTANATNLETKFYDDNILLGVIKKNASMNGSTISIFEWNTKYTTVGNHVLKVVVGNSSKQTTVHINKHPTIILNYSNSDWLIGLVILLIAIISLILGYDNYKKRFK